MGALLAHFTYSEYLPKVLGWQKMQEFDLLPKKTGYFRGMLGKFENFLELAYFKSSKTKFYTSSNVETVVHIGISVLC